MNRTLSSTLFQAGIRPAAFPDFPTSAPFASALFAPLRALRPAASVAASAFPSPLPATRDGRRPTMLPARSYPTTMETS